MPKGNKKDGDKKGGDDKAPKRRRKRKLCNCGVGQAHLKKNYSECRYNTKKEKENSEQTVETPSKNLTCSTATAVT